MGGTSSTPKTQSIERTPRKRTPSPASRDPGSKTVEAYPGATIAERELLDRQLIAALPVAIYACDAHGRITMANDAAAAIWGGAMRLGDSVCDKSFRVYLPDGTLLRPEEFPIAVALRERRAIDGQEIVIERPDGSRRDVLSHPRPLFDASGELAGAINMLVDITERKRAEGELGATRDALATQVAMLTKLSELSRRLAVTHDLAPALEAIVRTLVELHRAQHGLFALYDKRSGRLAIGASVSFDEAALAPVRTIVPGPSAGASGTAFFTRKRVIVEDIETDTRFDSLRRNARATGFRAVHSTPVLTRDGEPLGVLSVYFGDRRVPTKHEMDLADMCALHAADAIEAARDEQAVRESEQRFRTMADHSPVIIWVRESDGACTFLSRAWYELTGQTIEHALSGGWLEAIDPIDRAFVQTILRSASERREPFRIEYRLRARDGAQRWVIDAAAPRFADDGTFHGYVGSIIDITERKRTEVALQESEARFRRMADSAPVLIWVSGRDNKRTWFNQPWLDFVGRSMAQEIGDGWSDNVHPDDLARCLRTYTEAFDARRPFAMEFRLRRRDGDYRWVLDKGVPLYDGAGGFAGFIGSCFDMTEERHKEQALKQADRRKDEFLASLAHELRNPLAPMQNALAIMSVRADDAEEVASARTLLQRQMRQMVRLIDDLLDVNRISRGKIQLRRERIDLAAALTSAIETSRPLIDELGHALAVDLPLQPIAVDGDLTRLAQVFANLLNNAAKYTDRGGHIGVRLWREGDDAIVEVRDDGVGIAHDDLESVFEMFTQVESGSAHTRGGLGIGLAIAKRLVEMHGGTIRAASAGAGRGSSFTVRLPAIAPSESVDPPPARSTSGVDATSPRRRVLIAEDHKDSAASLARLLEVLGNSVRVARDGAEAVMLADEYRPNVILLDIGMPKMNGYEACERIRAQTWSRDIVIAALTGWGTDSDRRRSRDAGFDYHLVKPVDLDALEQVLEATR